MKRPPGDLSELASHWDDLAKDARWAVLSAPERRGHRWGDDDFWATGRQDVRRVLAECASVGASPAREAALDFGCGVGRLSAALSLEFERVDGIDVSARMIASAKASVHSEKVTFHENRSSDLRLFADRSFDFVFSLIVLQHIPPPFALQYVEEFARVLRPGGIAYFQAPTAPRRRFGSRRMRTHLRRGLFLLPGAKLLWRTLRGELPIEMYGLTAKEVERTLERSGLELVHSAADEAAGEDWDSLHYICRKK